MSYRTRTSPADSIEQIDFSNGRYRYQLLISRKDVARLAGVTEDYLRGIEAAMYASAQWSEMTNEQRREWERSESKL